MIRNLLKPLSRQISSKNSPSQIHEKLESQRTNARKCIPFQQILRRKAIIMKRKKKLREQSLQKNLYRRKALIQRIFAREFMWWRCFLDAKTRFYWTWITRSWTSDWRFCHDRVQNKKFNFLCREGVVQKRWRKLYTNQLLTRKTKKINILYFSRFHLVKPKIPLCTTKIIFFILFHSSEAGCIKMGLWFLVSGRFAISTLPKRPCHVVGTWVCSFINNNVYWPKEAMD